MMEAVGAADARHEMLLNGFVFRMDQSVRSLDERLAARALSVRYPCVNLPKAVDTLPLALWDHMLATDTFLPWYYHTHPEQFVRTECGERYMDPQHVRRAFYAYYATAHGLILSDRDAPPRLIRQTLEAVQAELLDKRVQALMTCDALIYSNLRKMQEAYFPSFQGADYEALYTVVGLAIHITLGWKALRKDMANKKQFVPLQALVPSAQDPLRELFVRLERHHVLSVLMRKKFSGRKHTDLCRGFVLPYLAMKGVRVEALGLQPNTITTAKLESVRDTYDVLPDWRTELERYSIERFDRERPNWTRA
jgi:hypothetical protein